MTKATPAFIFTIYISKIDACRELVIIYSKYYKLFFVLPKNSSIWPNRIKNKYSAFGWEDEVETGLYYIYIRITHK